MVDTPLAVQPDICEDAEQLSVWQYNRDFYCIVDHDREVSCMGFLFFGSYGSMFIHLDQAHQDKLSTLQKIFEEEFDTRDNITADMLRMLLKRLIIITTRLAKEQYLPQDQRNNEQFEVLRQYNFLVEMHFRKEHQVKFYADQLNKSPKTLSNLFSLLRHKSPLHIIHERIILEAKRLFMYSDKSAKEIAFELGFEDAAHFSRFFKNFTDQNPSSYRKQLSGANSGTTDDTLVL